MHERHRALTEAIAKSYEEAARVCLSRHHNSPITAKLSDDGAETTTEIVWSLPDARTLSAWGNAIDTTEMGAYCCVIAGIEEIRGLFAVRRADTGTGADYYIGPAGAGITDLEDCLRLEVSGVDAGDHREVRTRLIRKIRQASEGKSNLPAVAGVFGFSAKLLLIKNVPEM